MPGFGKSTQFFAIAAAQNRASHECRERAVGGHCSLSVSAKGSLLSLAEGFSLENEG